jgi:hypothetical protein
MSAPGFLQGLSSKLSGFKSNIDSPLKVPSTSKSTALVFAFDAAPVAVVVSPGVLFAMLMLTGAAPYGFCAGVLEISPMVT